MVLSALRVVQGCGTIEGTDPQSSQSGGRPSDILQVIAVSSDKCCGEYGGRVQG